MSKIMTPATAALAVGVLTVGTLYTISQAKNKDASTTAAYLFNTLCQLATSNPIATLVSTGATVTAATYTFVTKPLSWMYNKCSRNTADEEIREYKRHLNGYESTL